MVEGAARRDARRGLGPTQGRGRCMRRVPSAFARVRRGYFRRAQGRGRGRRAFTVVRDPAGKGAARVRPANDGREAGPPTGRRFVSGQRRRRPSAIFASLSSTSPACMNTTGIRPSIRVARFRKTAAGSRRLAGRLSRVRPPAECRAPYRAVGITNQCDRLPSGQIIPSFVCRRQATPAAKPAAFVRPTSRRLFASPAIRDLSHRRGLSAAAANDAGAAAGTSSAWPCPATKGTRLAGDCDGRKFCGDAKVADW